MNQEQALDILFPDGYRDLTSVGLAYALNELRRRDKPLSQRVERALKCLMGQLFPRRKLPWYQTSRGTTYRLALLLENPYFCWDVALLREMLGIQEGLMSRAALGSEKILPIKSPSRPEIGDQASFELALASIWYRCHVHVFLGLPDEPSFSSLTARQMALARETARLDFSQFGPDLRWLTATAPSHERCADGRDDQVPYHRAIALLMQRHGLPQHVCGNIRLYVLTGNEPVAARLPPLPSKVGLGAYDLRINPGGESISTVVEEMDEFTTEAEWRTIWKERVAPLQRLLMSRRGQQPSGQKTLPLGRLREGMPLFQAWERTGSIREALDELAFAGSPLAEMEDETARSLVKNLEELLKPRDI